METNHKDNVRPIVSKHGETVWELIAKANHSLAYVEIAKGKASRPHYHPKAEESYYIISGKARMVIGDETEFLMPGMSVLIPQNKTHQIFNDGQEPLVFLTICVPSWTPDCSVFV